MITLEGRSGHSTGRCVVVSGSKPLAVRHQLLIFIVASCGCKLSVAQLSTGDSLTIVGATVIDVRTGARSVDQSIRVDDGKISAIENAASLDVPVETEVVRADGKFIIPGLWDMHTHIQSQRELDLFFPLLIANGVLAIRDAGGLLPREFASGASRHEQAPRVVAAGDPVNGPTPDGEDDVSIVDRLADEGVGYIKIMSLVPRTRLVAIAERAAEHGLHIAGHVPVYMSPVDAAEIGLRSMEHMLEFHLAISNRETELRNERISAIENEHTIRSVGFPRLGPLLADWNNEKANALFGVLAASDSWQVPTLNDFRAWAAATDPSFWQDPEFSLLPDEWLNGWRANNHFEKSHLSADELADFESEIRGWYEAQLDLARRMHAAGVRFLAGTDTSAWNFQVPGTALHDELAIFVEIGMTPLEALQTATVNVAEYLRLDGYDGTVSVGQAADFIILDADPLIDIRNIRRIFGVISDGSYVGRRELNELSISGKLNFDE